MKSDFGISTVGKNSVKICSTSSWWNSTWVKLMCSNVIWSLLLKLLYPLTTTSNERSAFLRNNNLVCLDISIFLQVAVQCCSTIMVGNVVHCKSWFTSFGFPSQIYGTGRSSTDFSRFLGFLHHGHMRALCCGWSILRIPYNIRHHFFHTWILKNNISGVYPDIFNPQT